MFEMIVATAGAGGVRIEITADVEETAYPGQPIAYTFKISGVSVGKKVYWSMYEDYATTTVGADRLYDGVTTGVLTVTGLPIVVTKRVMGKTLQGRKLVMRAALTAAEANNPDTALATTPEIVIGKSPTGSTTSTSLIIPANVYALTVTLSGGGGGGSGGAPSGSFRYYTGGAGGGGVVYSGVVYVKPGTSVSLSKGTGGAGRPAGQNGYSGNSTILSGLTAPSASVSGGGGGGGTIGDNQTGASGRVGSPNGSGASGGSGGASAQGTGGTGSTGYGTLTWGL